MSIDKYKKEICDFLYCNLSLGMIKFNYTGYGRIYMTDDEIFTPHLTRKEIKLIKLLRMQSDECQQEMLEKISIVQDKAIRLDGKQNKE